MNIIIIGTGNTAAVFGRRFKAAGHSILQLFGRNAPAASQLAYELDTESTNDPSLVRRDADLYLLAVPDIAIAEVMQQLQLTLGTVVHSAASVSKEVLSGAQHYGVFYPLQTLKKESVLDADIPIIIDASDKATLARLDALARSVSGKVLVANDEQRLKLHVAAVFCNNFVNHLFVLAEDFCKKESIDFKMMLPLIRETAQRMETMAPLQAQTGPALRGDENTVEKHRQLLAFHPRLLQFYDLFSRSIQKAAV